MVKIRTQINNPYMILMPHVSANPSFSKLELVQKRPFFKEDFWRDQQTWNDRNIQAMMQYVQRTEEWIHKRIWGYLEFASGEQNYKKHPYENQKP